MKYAYFSAVSFLAVFSLFALQNILLLTTNSLAFVYEGLGALQLYASLCLLYFSLRYVEARRNFCIRHLFAKVFLPVLVYAAAVLFDAPFNAVSLATLFVSLFLLCASIFCVALAHTAKRDSVTEFSSANVEQSANVAHGEWSAHSLQHTLFSKREQEVASLILQGKTAQETADALFVSLATVKTHIQHIYEKTGVHNRTEFALFMQTHPFN